jgi:hypothetical protein
VSLANGQSVETELPQRAGSEGFWKTATLNCLLVRPGVLPTEAWLFLP